MLEHEGVQKELVELAREIGVSDDGVDGSGASKEKEEDVEFEEMIKEIKQVGKTYVAKMDKLEKVCPSFHILLHVTDQGKYPYFGSVCYNTTVWGRYETVVSIALAPLALTVFLANIPGRGSPKYVDDAGNVVGYQRTKDHKC